MSSGSELDLTTGYAIQDRTLQLRQDRPAGVVVAIAPRNLPLMLETGRVAPALAWGNTVALKPAVVIQIDSA